MKVALAKIVRDFYLKTSAKTPTKIELDPSAFSYMAKTPLLIEVEKRQQH